MRIIEKIKNRIQLHYMIKYHDEKYGNYFKDKYDTYQIYVNRKLIKKGIQIKNGNRCPYCSIKFNEKYNKENYVWMK